MKKNIFYHLIGIILFSIVFSSCVDEKDFDFDRMTPITINPSVQLNKLVSEEISLNDFFNIDSIEGVVLTVQSDQGGEYLEFTYSFDTSIIQNIPTINVNPTNISLPPLNLEGTSYTGDFYFPDLNQSMFNSEVDFPELEHEQKLDSIYLKGGELQINVNSNIDYTTYMIISCDEIRRKDNNSSFNDTIYLSQSKRKNTGTNTTDLSDYKIIVNNNKINFKYRLHIAANGALHNYNVGLNIAINNIQFDAAFGKMGKFDVDFSDNIDIDFFKESSISRFFEGEKFSLEKLFIDFKTETNNGIPSVININQFGVYDKDDVFHDAIINPADRVIPVNPALSLNTTETSSKTVQFNVNLLNLAPQKLSFDASLTLNPNNVNCFVVNDPYVKVQADIHIPFKGKLNDLDYDVEFYNDLYEGKNTEDNYADYIKDATIYLDMTNYFPISIGAELYGVDTSGNEIGKILNINNGTNDVIINGANVDINGNVTSPSMKKTTISANSTNIAILKKSKKIILKLKLNTSATNDGTKPYIRFKKDSKIIINAGVNLKTNISINPFNK
ncbi:MAG: hypothetical protein PHN41_01010 [Bacteroidales bacterium]|jgi:hypothetical protein|nr:hypothetical protein [Bacteroidales bacterium]MDD4702874.1 hypothetical protein [Bacteroidales bacterium]MDX9797457.1 hypothetical protein [Bacteroidales bacterium]